MLARHGDWLGAAAVTGSTGLLVSPISWATTGSGSCPRWWSWSGPATGWWQAWATCCSRWHRSGIRRTPAGPREYGFHWLVTLVANCYLTGGLAFLAYMARRAYLVMTAAPPRRIRPGRAMRPL